MRLETDELIVLKVFSFASKLEDIDLFNNELRHVQEDVQETRTTETEKQRIRQYPSGSIRTNISAFGGLGGPT